MCWQGTHLQLRHAQGVELDKSFPGGDSGSGRGAHLSRLPDFHDAYFRCCCTSEAERPANVNHRTGARAETGCF